MKKILSITLIMCFVLGMFSIIPVSALTLSAGDFVYNILEDGTLEASIYKGDDTEVVIPSTVRGYTVSALGDDLFNYHTTMTSVTIPSSVTTIGERTFRNCRSLKMDKLPSTVTSIGNQAFSYCDNITSFTFSKNLTHCGQEIFLDGGIESVVFEAGTTKIFNGVMKNTHSLKSVHIPDSVTNIEFSAFMYCTGLSTVRMSENIETIDGYAFSHCDDLTAIKIPNTLKTGGNYIFTESGVKNITLENGLTEIFDYMFYDCKDIQSITLPDSIKRLGRESFGKCTSLKSITIPASVSEAVFPFSDSSITSATIKDGATEVLDTIFYEARLLEKVILPDTVKAIGHRAFCYSKISTLDFLDGITEIENDAFADCAYLDEVVIPASVENGGQSVFAHSSVKKITFAEGITEIDARFCQDAENLETVVLPESLKGIEEYAFNRCISLSKIRLPYYLEYVRYNIFDNCTSLKSITIPPHLDTYFISPFKLSSIETVKFMSGVSVIYNGMFSYTHSVKEVIIPQTAETIQTKAFIDCINLKSVTIPKSVKTIEDYAFGYVLADENDKDSAVSLGKDFTIYGYRNTEAKRYADANGLNFVPLDTNLMGDVDLNGVVNIMDVTLIQMYASELETLTDEQYTNADVTNDGNVNIFDATQVQFIIAELA